MYTQDSFLYYIKVLGGPSVSLDLLRFTFAAIAQFARQQVAWPELSAPVSQLQGLKPSQRRFETSEIRGSGLQKACLDVTPCERLV